MNKDISFEDALKRLDEIIIKLNSFDIPLEEAMELYTESSALITLCTKSLNEAKLTIEEIYPES